MLHFFSNANIFLSESLSIHAVKISRNKRKRQPGMLGRSSGNYDWLLANAIACVPRGFPLRNARNASDCVWMETGLQSVLYRFVAVVSSHNESVPRGCLVARRHNRVGLSLKAIEWSASVIQIQIQIQIQMGICRARLTNCPGALTNVRMLCETGEL